MSHALDFQALRARFTSAWKAYGFSNVAVLYDSSIVTKPAPQRFIRFAVRPSGEKDTALGGGRVRVENYGRIWIQVGIPKTDLDEGERLAEAATAIFRRWESADTQLRCLEVERDTSIDGEHHIITVKVSYGSTHYLGAA